MTSRPEPPLLNRKATIAAGTAIGFGEVDGYEASRAFLAAHDPEALATAYFKTHKHTTHSHRRVLEDALRWLGLGGDDA
jgi:general stress protein 26